MPFKSTKGGDMGDGLKRFFDGVAPIAPDALLRGALVLESNWKQILLTPGTGRVYGKRKHRASSPGDPPAPDYGNLQRSITHETASARGTRSGRGSLGSALESIVVRVGTNVEYAEPLEFGTTNAGKSHNVVIEPRPHARPALAASKEQMTDAVVATLKRGSYRGN
jgi:hypothetical protein